MLQVESNFDVVHAKSVDAGNNGADNGQVIENLKILFYWNLSLLSPGGGSVTTLSTYLSKSSGGLPPLSYLLVNSSTMRWCIQLLPHMFQLAVNLAFFQTWSKHSGCNIKKYKKNCLLIFIYRYILTHVRFLLFITYYVNKRCLESVIYNISVMFL